MAHFNIQMMGEIKIMCIAAHISFYNLIDLYYRVVKITSVMMVECTLVLNLKLNFINLYWNFDHNLVEFIVGRHCCNENLDYFDMNLDYFYTNSVHIALTHLDLDYLNPFISLDHIIDLAQATVFS